MHDEHAPHPAEASQALQETERERHQPGEEKAYAEHRHGERRERESLRDRPGERDDRERERCHGNGDAERPPSYELMQRGLVAARAVLRGQLRRGRLDHLAGDRFEDEHAKERDEDRVLLGGEEPCHHELVAETEHVGDGRRGEEPERTGVRARSSYHRREYDEAMPLGQATSRAPVNAARSSTASSMARRVERSRGASRSRWNVTTSRRPR